MVYTAQYSASDMSKITIDAFTQGFIAIASFVEIIILALIITYILKRKK